MIPRPVRQIAAALVVASLACTAGCATLTRMETRTQSVTIVTDPPGATVSEVSPVGKLLVGKTPLAFTEKYEVKHLEGNLWWWMFWPVGLAGMLVAYNTPPHVVTPARDRILVAELEGYDETRVKIRTPGDDKSFTLELKAGRGAPLPIAAAPSSGPIVAVFDLEDSRQALKPGEVDQVTEYLAVKLTEKAGYRVIPRAQLRQRLVAEKTESYKECYDQACQIDLGRALAAQKSLSAKLLRIGERCALTATLFDLKSEAAERAASVTTNCTIEELIDGVDRLGEQLGSPK